MRKKTIYLAVFIVGFLGIITIFWVNYYYEQDKKQMSYNEISDIEKSQSTKEYSGEKVSKEKGKVGVLDSIEETTQEVHSSLVENVYSTKTEEAFDKAIVEETGYVYLVSTPEKIEIEVEEGQRIKKIFSLSNEGTKPALINIYKFNENGPNYSNKSEIARLAGYKNKFLPKNPTEKDLRKAKLFSGPPWLLFYPYFYVLEADNSVDIEVTVEAKDLKAGEYEASLIVLGVTEEESLVVPVYIKAKGAPKVKLSKIEVDDGFSAETTGNMNNIANPGEKVALSIYFENTGVVSAEDLTLEISGDEASLKILNNGFLQIPFIREGSQFQAKFIIEVSNQVHPDIPPTVNLTVVDKAGRKWEENFYVGEAGKFNYPTGFIFEENRKRNILGRE